jgi:3-oxoacyl-[acyl-carrier-protein] synthase II
VRRVLVTGVGHVTPLGLGREATWNGLVEGRSAIETIASYDASSLRTGIGAEVAGLEPRDYVRRRSLRTMTREDVLAVVAASLAMTDAGIDLEGDPEGRAALFTASNKEISRPEHFEEVAVEVRGEDGTVDMQRFGAAASSGVHPLFFVEGLQGASLFYISEAFGLQGVNTYFAGTAEAGAIAIGRAFRAIRRGEADVALAGGADAPVNWWNMAKIDALGVLTRRSGPPAEACRPFDAERDGTVMGEGGAFLVLEAEEHARARGARPVAEVTGFATAIDTHALITPDPTGRPLARALAAAGREAGTAPEDVGYVATHGSGTRLGDASEAAALREVFGPVPNGTAASSVKPATGHLVGAAGALNAAVAALAIDAGVLPPSLNLSELDPACTGPSWVRGEAREVAVRHAVAVARGLEGQNVVLQMSAATGEEST